MPCAPVFRFKAPTRCLGWTAALIITIRPSSQNSYTFDANDKIVKVDDVTAYVYDGEGARVKKLVGEDTRFIYGTSGDLIMEFDRATGNLKKEYISGGITIEPTAVNSNGTQYPTGDNLGSPRVITNSSGSVVSRHDYKPFGEEIGAGVGGRTTGIGYSNMVTTIARNSRATKEIPRLVWTLPRLATSHQHLVGSPPPIR